jgi:hypothetical protein
MAARQAIRILDVPPSYLHNLTALITAGTAGERARRSLRGRKLEKRQGHKLQGLQGQNLQDRG